MTSGEPRASIVVPAHDEAAVLGRLLDGIAPLGADHDVLVVANGCTDATAEVARGYPWCRLVEIPTASKIAALNAGDAAARSSVRVYLDVDVSVGADALRALVEALTDPAPVIASPPVRIDVTGASVLARAYQRIWALTDYRLREHTGSGIYGMSAAGRARFDAFPEVIADDLWARLRFAPAERRVVGHEPFTVHAPRTIRAQVRRLGRTMAGELQLVGDRGPAQPEPAGARGRLLGRVARRPLLWPAFVVYSAAYLGGRIGARRKLARGRLDVWERDDTSR